jgi:transcriptional regulator with XRE-family HTH domain
MEIKMDIGARLRFIRSKFNLSLDKAAAMFDITAQTLSRYENGKRTPDNDFLESYGKKFLLSGDWLLYGEPPIFKTSSVEKDIKEVFVELSALINSGTGRKISVQEIIRGSLDKIAEDTPENFIVMLEYMLKDAEVRKNMFQFFYLFQRPEADKRRKSLRRQCPE